MFGKLLKHELGATGRILAPLYGAVLLLTGLSALLFRIGLLVTPSLSAHNWFSAIATVMSVLLVLGLFAMVIVTVVLHVMRFYRMLGDEGYLAFTLPVTPGQQLSAKLLRAMVWTLCAELAMVGSAFLLIWARASSWPESVPVDRGGVLLALLMLLLLVSLAGAYLMFYLCCAIGSQWGQNRLLASAVTYVVLAAALQILGLIAVVIFVVSGGADALITWTVHGVRVSQDLSNLVFAALGILSGVVLVLDVIGFFATRWLLTKKLNLT